MVIAFEKRGFAQPLNRRRVVIRRTNETDYGHLGEIKHQVNSEPFANHMGISLRDIAPGYALVEAMFSEKMNNFHGLIHGGAIFSLIDEAFGVASNSHGTVALALNMNLTYISPPKANSLLIAEAKEESRTRRTAAYRIEVRQGERKARKK